MWVEKKGNTYRRVSWYKRFKKEIWIFLCFEIFMIDLYLLILILK